MTEQYTTPFHVLDDTDDLNPRIRERARKLLAEWDDWKYGLNPKTSAAAAYYAAGLLEGREGTVNSVPTQDDMNRVFGAGKPAVSKRYREILDEVEGL